MSDEVYNLLFTYDLTFDTGVLTPDEAADAIIRYIEVTHIRKGSSNPKDLV